MPIARPLVERYKKSHLAAQVRSSNGLRGIFKFSEILGSPSYVAAVYYTAKYHSIIGYSMPCWTMIVQKLPHCIKF